MSLCTAVASLVTQQEQVTYPESPLLNLQDLNQDIDHKTKVFLLLKLHFDEENSNLFQVQCNAVNWMFFCDTIHMTAALWRMRQLLPEQIKTKTPQNRLHLLLINACIFLQIVRCQNPGKDHQAEDPVDPDQIRGKANRFTFRTVSIWSEKNGSVFLEDSQDRGLHSWCSQTSLSSTIFM